MDSSGTGAQAQGGYALGAQDRERAPAEWSDVRRWAADSGLNSAAAIEQWLDRVTRSGATPTDPRASALLRMLQQYSMRWRLGEPLPDLQSLPFLYGYLLRVLSKPRVGSAYKALDGTAVYPPGIDGPGWVRPLVDPLAEGGRLWPPSPVTATVRMAEAVHDAFGYLPLDSDGMIVSLATQPPLDAADGSRALEYLGSDIYRAIKDLGGVRIDPAAPKLAPPADIVEARQRWPNVSPSGFESPYVVVVARGSAHGPLGAWSPAVGPVHVGMITQDGRVVASVAVSDTTGSVVSAGGAAAPLSPIDLSAHGLYRVPRIVEASNNDPRLVTDLLMPFVRAVVEGRPDAAGLAPMRVTDASHDWRVHNGADQPYVARVFEPAEVLAAIDLARRAAAVASIDEAMSRVGGLANLAARAYRGNLATANVPEEVRRLAAAQAIARACSPGATLQDRARVADAAQTLGLSFDGAQARDLTSVCDAAADAVQQLYGRS
ncbi:hypothetical protein pclt_cds_1077 [Pandoravirus celtis]|uniref:Uncharacterized protein n=1 Tax=Pandoravirus celtis TaxID=2568002 RepID=A0A4D6EIL4_9VIRU|nr:hypothetical protein pclt_cds_1077 [Pandoravirus celtis]